MGHNSYMRCPSAFKYKCFFWGVAPCTNAYCFTFSISDSQVVSSKKCNVLLYTLIHRLHTPGKLVLDDTTPGSSEISKDSKVCEERLHTGFKCQVLTRYVCSQQQQCPHGSPPSHFQTHTYQGEIGRV